MHRCIRFSVVSTRAVLHRRNLSDISTVAVNVQCSEKNNLPPQPKRPPSSFTKFLLDQKATVPALKSKTICQVSKHVRNKWKELSHEEKEAYVARSKEEFAEYHKKLAAYNLSIGSNDEVKEKPRRSVKRNWRSIIRNHGGPELQTTSPFALYFQEYARQLRQAIGTESVPGASVNAGNLTSGQSARPGGGADSGGHGTETPRTVAPSELPTGASSQSNVPDYVKTRPQLAIGNRLMAEASAGWASMSDQEKDVYNKKLEVLKKVRKQKVIEWWTKLPKEKRDLIVDACGLTQTWSKKMRPRKFKDHLVEHFGEERAHSVFELVGTSHANNDIVEGLPWRYLLALELKNSADKKQDNSNKCDKELNTKT